MVRWLFRRTLTQWIVAAMVAGLLLGHFAPEAAKNTQVFATIFLRLIKCLLAPLIFGTLVVGIASHGDDLKSVGRLGVKAILYFEVVTTLALGIGLLAVNICQPGAGMALPTAAKASNGPPPTWQATLEHLAPSSFFDAAARNDILQVVVFAMLFGVAVARSKGEARETMIRFCEALTEAMFKFTKLIMNLAPIGVGAAVAYTVGHDGFGPLLGLVKLVATLYGALAVFGLTVLLPAALWAGVPVRRFIAKLKDPILLAFTTTSSDAAMPEAMARLVQLGVPQRIVSFVMPLGYSFNLDGSTLHLAVASVFVAQAAGVHLSLGRQLTIMLTLMLTSKGMAGVPRASQVILAGTLTSFDLPLEGVVLIQAVDTFMDMGRTTVNLIGNCLATAVVARMEGELLEPAETAAG
jgi:proton glutamate symport protein